MQFLAVLFMLVVVIIVVVTRLVGLGVLTFGVSAMLLIVLGLVALALAFVGGKVKCLSLLPQQPLTALVTDVVANDDGFKVFLDSDGVTRTLNVVSTTWEKGARIRGFRQGSMWTFLDGQMIHRLDVNFQLSSPCDYD